MRTVMITHKCEKSLKRGKVIRFCKKFEEWDIEGDYKAWRLFQNTIPYCECDNDVYLEHISEIDYCPFCGEKLIESEK